MIEVLRSDDLLLLCCEATPKALICQWVQVNPVISLEALHGSIVTVKQPKTAETLTYTIAIPKTLTEHVFTDVEFSLAS